MNLATDLIVFDHQELRDLFDRFEAKPHRSVVMDICHAIERHERMEDEIIEPAASTVDIADDERPDHGHEHIDEMVTAIREASGRDALRELLGELRPVMLAHMVDEETVVLPAMEDALGVSGMNELGFRIGDWKRAEDRSGEDLDTLLELTREELYEKAKHADVSGRSHMNKLELADALAAG